MAAPSVTFAEPGVNARHATGTQGGGSQLFLDFLREFFGWRTVVRFDLDVVSIKWGLNLREDEESPYAVVARQTEELHRGQSASRSADAAPDDGVAVEDADPMESICEIDVPMKRAGFWFNRSFAHPVAELEYIRFVNHGFMIRLVTLFYCVVAVWYGIVVLASPRLIPGSDRTTIIIACMAVVFVACNAAVSLYRLRIHRQVNEASIAGSATKSDDVSSDTDVPECVKLRNLRFKLARVELATLVLFTLCVAVGGTTASTSAQPCADVPYDDAQPREDACRAIQLADVVTVFLSVLWLRFPKHLVPAGAVAALANFIVLGAATDYGWEWAALRAAGTLVVICVYGMVAANRDAADRRHFTAIVAAHVAYNKIEERHDLLALVVQAMVPRSLAARVAALQQQLDERESSSLEVRASLSNSQAHADAEETRTGAADHAHAAMTAKRRDVAMLLKSIKDVSSKATVAVTDAVDYAAFERACGSYRVPLAGLAHLFTLFDVGTRLFTVDRASVFGDAYIVTAGLVRGTPATPLQLVRFCLWQQQLDETRMLKLRSCVVTGHLSGGVVGSSAALRYQVGGEALARALQGALTTPPGTVHVCTDTFARVAQQERAGEDDVFSDLSSAHDESSGPAATVVESYAREKTIAFRAIREDQLDMTQREQVAQASRDARMTTVTGSDSDNRSVATGQDGSRSVAATARTDRSLAHGAMANRVATIKEEHQRNERERTAQSTAPVANSGTVGTSGTSGSLSISDTKVAIDDGYVDESKTSLAWGAFADPEIEALYQGCDTRRSTASGGGLLLAVIGIFWISDLASGGHPLGSPRTTDTGDVVWWARVILPIVAVSLSGVAVGLAAGGRWASKLLVSGLLGSDGESSSDATSSSDSSSGLHLNSDTAEGERTQRFQTTAPVLLGAAIVCLSLWLWAMPTNFATYEAVAIHGLTVHVIVGNVLRGLRFWWIILAAAVLLLPPTFKYGWSDTSIVDSLFFLCAMVLYIFVWTNASRKRFGSRYHAANRLMALGRVTNRLNELCTGLMPPHVLHIGVTVAFQTAVRNRVATGPDFATSALVRNAAAKDSGAVEDDDDQCIAGAVSALGSVLRGDYGGEPLDTLEWLSCAHITLIPLADAAPNNNPLAAPSDGHTPVNVVPSPGLPSGSEAKRERVKKASSPLDTLWPVIEQCMCEANDATLRIARKKMRAKRPKKNDEPSPASGKADAGPTENAGSLRSVDGNPLDFVGGDCGDEDVIDGDQVVPLVVPKSPTMLERMWESHAPDGWKRSRDDNGGTVRHGARNAHSLRGYDPNTSHVRLFRALHDTLIVGGPLHERAHRQASALAAANVARFVALLAPRARALGFRLAVAFAAEEAAGALVGRGTMRYALSGPALRFAERLGSAARMAAEAPVARFLANQRPRRAGASSSSTDVCADAPSAICYMTRHFRDLMGVAQLIHEHHNVPMGFDAAPFVDSQPFARHALADRHIGVARPLMCVIAPGNRAGIMERERSHTDAPSAAVLLPDS